VIAIPSTVEFWFLTAGTFLFGLMFGSFLNVCIYRLPRGLSVVRPRSACPACEAPIAAYDNIPVLSWFILGGRCRSCRVRISPRYWIVELLTGLLFVASLLKFGPGLEAVKYCAFCFLVLGLIFTDADLKLLPDDLTLPGLGLGLALSLFIPVDGFAASLLRPALDGVSGDIAWRVASFANGLIGAAAGGLFIWGIGEAYFRVRGIEGMGFGDVKLMAMIGSFLGIKLTVLTIMFGALGGSIAGFAAMIVVYRKRGRRWRERGHGPAVARDRARASARLLLRHYEMPFGVFLGAASLLAAFFGKPLVDWYLGQFR
jgi:leader peptidase (prepilin peptidase)/N-methyltransferase